MATRVVTVRHLLVHPGEGLDVGDRTLRVVAPPCFDAPDVPWVPA